MASFTMNNSKTMSAEEFNALTHLEGGRPCVEIQSDLTLDSILVIDANVSLKGSWAKMAADAAQLAYALIKRDPNGIDVYFAGFPSKEAATASRPKGGFLGITNPNYVAELFLKVVMSEDEFLIETLDSIWTAFTDFFAASPNQASIDKLSIVTWTDGTIDLDKLEAQGVAHAKRLATVGAPNKQAGYQLLQVGGDAKIKRRFTILDEELVKQYNLTHDIFDRAEYVPGQLAENITKIGTGAVDPKADAEGEN